MLELEKMIPEIINYCWFGNSCKNRTGGEMYIFLERPGICRCQVYPETFGD